MTAVREPERKAKGKRKQSKKVKIGREGGRERGSVSECSERSKELTVL
jgi:hypothetical protein